MSQLTVTAIALLGLVGLAKLISGQATTSQSQYDSQAPMGNTMPQQQGYMMPQGSPFGQNAGQMFSSPNDMFGQQPRQMGMNPQQQQQRNPGNLLGNLLNGLGGRMQQQQPQQQQQQMQGMVGNQNQDPRMFLQDLLRRIPQLVQNIMTDVSTLLSGLGRNQQTPLNMNQMGMRGLDSNPLNNNQGGLLDVNGVLDLTRPVTDALSQGRMPDVNQVTGQLSKTVSNLGQNLQRTLSNSTPQLLSPGSPASPASSASSAQSAQ